MPNGDIYAKFDINDPKLPIAVKNGALASGGYPYAERLKRKLYERQLVALQSELVKLQAHLNDSGERIAIVFEGRDAAGKGGTIKNYLSYLNPRSNKIVALPKPSDRERGEWYFQRYAGHLPAAGETALFDRSWYNRAGVEPVMGFCSPEQCTHFLNEAPRFEHMIVDDGIHFFKFWLEIGREMQLKRFHDRRHNPLKVWKLSPIDMKSLDLWDAYEQARNEMLAATDSDFAPWTIIRANDKRRSRLNVIASVLSRLDYAGKDESAIIDLDSNIAMSAKDYLALSR